MRAAEPALGQPVVLDGVKYRIRAIEGDTAHVREHFAPRREADVDVRRLEYDKRVGVWRLIENGGMRASGVYDVAGAQARVTVQRAQRQAARSVDAGAYAGPDLQARLVGF